MKEGRELAEIQNPDLVVEDHGVLILDITFIYESGDAQGLPIIVEGTNGGKFIKALLRAIGTDSLRRCARKSCWVTQRDGLIKVIEPLHKKDGVKLDIDEFNRRNKNDNHR